MKIVIFTTKNHLYANKVIKALLNEKNIQIDLIIESKVSGIKKYIKKAGIRYVFVQACKVLFFQFGSFIYALIFPRNYTHILYPYRKMIKNKNIIHTTKDINSKEMLRIIKKVNPDILASILANQILHEELLGIPKYGTVNMHPALLPSYRGVSPTFWVLANQEKKTGVSIHTITDKEIDKGKLVAQQEIPIHQSDSEHTLYMRCITLGTPLLISVLHNMVKGKTKVLHLKSKIKSSYYSIPTKNDIKRFYRNGRCFYRIRELFYEK